MSHWPDLIAEFLKTHKPPLHSNTLNVYRSVLRQFFVWVGSSGHEPNSKGVALYLETHPHWKASTRRLHSIVLVQFFRWTPSQLSWANDIPTVPHLQVTSHLPDPAVIQGIFSLIPPEQERDALLFRLIYAAGLRIGEALALRGHHLTQQQDEYVLRLDGRQRIVILTDEEVVRRLRARLAQLDTRDQFLFQARKNGRISPLRQQSMHERWITYTRKAGTVCSLEQLRHFYPQEQAGLYPPDRLCQILGYTRVHSVQRYYSSSLNQTAKVIE
ncbi:hypothetical protein E7T06_11370 [Deinococcus sp. Arct2-2]|uniref:tyrosine-type recombinase/integrase n=1 Tax=Deinococcus sp. Arct2-2 TaxID=2568653 RepID=UPI0010A515D7|nr:tyrosine-type recombinase/integrase [Deinococcus sp. Arct2-2]THF69607.1 hypothetical protein E7T06_11370 [Deinococcus sp. Arct2-2]